MELNVSIKRIEKKQKYMCISGINNKRRKRIASIGRKKNKLECHLRMYGHTWKVKNGACSMY